MNFSLIKEKVRYLPPTTSSSHLPAQEKTKIPSENTQKFQTQIIINQMRALKFVFHLKKKFIFLLSLHEFKYKFFFYYFFFSTLN